MTHNTPTDYAELISLHTRLVELGFSATLDEIERMRSTHSAEAIERALDEVDKTPGARLFLANLISCVRSDTSKASAPRRQLSAVPTGPRPGWKQIPIPFARHRPALRATEQMRIEGKDACVTVSAIDNDASVRTNPEES